MNLFLQREPGKVKTGERLSWNAPFEPQAEIYTPVSIRLSRTPSVIGKE